MKLTNQTELQNYASMVTPRFTMHH